MKFYSQQSVINVMEIRDFKLDFVVCMIDDAWARTSGWCDFMDCNRSVIDLFPIQ